MPAELSRYTIDRHNIIVDIDVTYPYIAMADDHIPLLPMRVVGSHLLQHIMGEDTKEFTVQLLERVRSSDRPVTIHYRCDGPAIKRLLRMTLSRQAGGAVDIAHTLIREEPLEAELRFVAGTAIDSVRCSMCNRVRHGDVWREPEDALAASLLKPEHANLVIYRICPPCHENALGPPAWGDRD